MPILEAVCYIVNAIGFIIVLCLAEAIVKYPYMCYKKAHDELILRGMKGTLFDKTMLGIVWNILSCILALVIACVFIYFFHFTPS